MRVRMFDATSLNPSVSPAGEYAYRIGEDGETMKALNLAVAEVLVHLDGSVATVDHQRGLITVRTFDRLEGAKLAALTGLIADNGYEVVRFGGTAAPVQSRLGSSFAGAHALHA